MLFIFFNQIFNLGEEKWEYIYIEINIRSQTFSKMKGKKETEKGIIQQNQSSQISLFGDGGYS